MLTTKTKDLTTLLGKNLNDPKARSVVSRIPGRSRSKKNTCVMHHIYRDYGLEFIEKPDNRVSTIFLYAKSRSQSAYGGQLPEHLAFGMTRDEVIKKMGEPDKDLGFILQWDRGLYRLSTHLEGGRVARVTLSAS